MNDIQQVKTGALAPSDYATFEMAKQNDGVLGGNDIAQIRSYAAYARAQAQAIHKTIAATSGIEDVAAIKAEATETAQTFAKVGIYADQRIGEILRELPKDRSFHGNQHQEANSTAREVTKATAIEDAGISKSQAYDLQAMAANPDIVQAVLDKAEADGKIVSRAQVLKAIKERDELRSEVEALERQNDELYEKANAPQEPRVIERIVESDSARRRIAELEHERDVYLEDSQKLREKWLKAQDDLRKANTILGETGRVQEVRRDVQFLTSVMKQHIKAFGMHSLSLDNLDEVDEHTKDDFLKVITEDYAMLQNVVQTLIAKNQMNLERI